MMSNGEVPTNLSRITSSVTPRQKPTKHVKRSRSFGGFGILMPQRNMDSLNDSWARPVLGHMMHNLNLESTSSLNGDAAVMAKNLTKSLKKAGLKVPKVPRLQRTNTIFECIIDGLKDCIQATEKDLISLPFRHGDTKEAAWEVHAARKFKSRLEFHLSKIIQLQEQYVIHEQLRKGVKNMAKAYDHHNGKSKKESLNNVESRYKECTQILCAIEAQFEKLLGTFHCQMKGLLGFARLKPGDVYEITLQHGRQKWKSRCHIGDGKQTWDNDTCVFKALLADVLSVQVVEVKILGNNSLLRKNCETKDLFSANPQMITVSISPHGTVKMSTYITWNPLEDLDESMNAFEPTYSTPPWTRSIYPVMDEYHLANIKEESPVSTSSHSDQSLPAMYNVSETDEFLRITDHDIFDMRPLKEALDSELFGSKSDVSSSRAVGLNEALLSLKAMLEDYQGKYELQKLDEQIHILHAMIKGDGGDTCSSCHSSESITIENALEAYDFLESFDYYNDGYGTSSNSLDQLDHDHCSGISESTTNTANSSGVFSTKSNQKTDGTPLEKNSGSNSVHSTTGNKQVDTALLWHLVYSERLLQNIGSFGPLRCRESYSLNHLKYQADILERLIAIAKNGMIITDLRPIMAEATKSKQLQQFWLNCVDGPELYVTMDRFFTQLERCYGDVVQERFDSIQVFEVFIARMMDFVTYDSKIAMCHPNITMHQLMAVMPNDPNLNIREYFDTLAWEVWLSSRLRFGDTDAVVKMMLTFKNDLPPPADCLRIIAMLLFKDDVEIQRSAASYLKSLNTYAAIRDRVLVTFVQSLEDTRPDMRGAACKALKILQASETMDRLVYMSQTDSSDFVKDMAKDALYSFGQKGRVAYEKLQLSYQGFPGVQLHSDKKHLTNGSDH